MSDPSPAPLTLPFIGWRGEVLPEWIDDNGHMNSLVYPQLFDKAMWPFFGAFLQDDTYLERRGLSLFQREFRVSFESELLLGDKIEVRCWILAHDAKRIHHLHELWHAEDGQTAPRRAAFGEYMSLHVDMTTRRTAPFPEDVMARLDAMAAVYARHARPVGAGQPIGISRRRG